jgi:hypothetical protein
MAEAHKPVRVAVNVMRARQTVVGFNIAVLSIQIAQIGRLPGGLKVSRLEHAVHVRADIALFMALALALLSLLALTLSSEFDEVGYCTRWTLVAGDILMYLSLAHTVTGFFAPLEAAIGSFAARIPAQAAGMVVLHTVLRVVAGAAWFLATYAGPLTALKQSPFPRATNIALGIAYLALLILLCWVGALSVQVETLDTGGQPQLLVGVLKELVQPFRW